ASTTDRLTTQNRSSKCGFHRCANWYSPVHTSVRVTTTRRTKPRREPTIHRTNQTTRSISSHRPMPVNVVQQARILALKTATRSLPNNVLISVHKTGRRQPRTRTSPTTVRVLIRPLRHRDILDVHARNLIQGINETVIKDVLNNKLYRLRSNGPEPVPLLLDVVHAGLELIFQVRDNRAETVEHRLDVFVIHVHDLGFHGFPFITNPSENVRQFLPQPCGNRLHPLPRRFQMIFPDVLHGEQDCFPVITNPPENWFQGFLPQPSSNSNDGIPHRFENVIPSPLHRRQHLIPMPPNKREHRRQDFLPQPARHNSNRIEHWLKNVGPRPLHDVHDRRPMLADPREHRL